MEAGGTDVLVVCPVEEKVRHVFMVDAESELSFVRRAVRNFTEYPEHRTYTDGEIEPGCLFAVRWGADDDCVLVLRLDKSYVPTIYGQAI